MNFKGFTIIVLTPSLLSSGVVWFWLKLPGILRLVSAKLSTCAFACAGYDQYDGLDQFRIGFCVWDGGGGPSLIVSLRGQDPVLQGIY